VVRIISKQVIMMTILRGMLTSKHIIYIVIIFVTINFRLFQLLLIRLIKCKLINQQKFRSICFQYDYSEIVSVCITISNIMPDVEVNPQGLVDSAISV
jgi:hypothetical protein